MFVIKALLCVFLVEFVMFKMSYELLKPSSMIIILGNNLYYTFSGIGKFIYDRFVFIRPFIVSFCNFLYDFITDFWNQLYRFFKFIYDLLSDIIEYIWDFFIVDIITCFDNLFKSVLNLVFSWFGFIDGVIGKRISLGYTELTLIFFALAAIFSIHLMEKNEKKQQSLMTNENNSKN